jgi:hypothetical protein
LTETAVTARIKTLKGPEVLVEQIQIRWLFGNNPEEHVELSTLKDKLPKVLDGKKSIYFAIVKPLEIVVGRPYLYKELVRQNKQYSLMYLYKNPDVKKSCTVMTLEELKSSLVFKKSEQETQTYLGEIFQQSFTDEKAEELRKKIYGRVAKLVYETIHS